MDETRYRAAEEVLWRSAGLRPSERSVRLACTGTDVRVQEVGEGPPAVFIHGGPNTGATWAPLLEHLRGFRCFVVDRPGTGLSPAFPIRADNLADIGAAFVADLLDGLGLGRAHLVASSFGGHLALRSAAAHPDRFDRMVQMACPALVPGDRVPGFFRGFARPWVRRILGVLPPSERASRMIMRQIGHGASLDAGTLPPALLPWYLALQRYTDTMRNDGEMIGQVLGSWEELRLTDELLAAVEVPTLFWWGADDTFGDDQVARHLVDTMPRAELVMVPAAGHLPWLDDPRAAAAATSSFLGADVPSS